MNKRESVSRVLGREITDTEVELIHDDWKAFYNEPVKYSNSIVISMVNQYLDKLRANDKA